MRKAFKTMATSLIVLGLAIPAFAQPTTPGWVAKGDDWETKKESLREFGEQFETSWDLYEQFRKTASGGIRLNWADMQKPEYDWSDIWTRTRGGLSFDPDLDATDGATSAPLTETGEARVNAKIKQIADTGGEYDPISDCRPPGVPRWASEPFLHEYIVTPDQTWLINEMVNDVRRVYTDGREHTPEADAYASWNGDTIGFWDGDILVTHTKYLMNGQYQRGIQPDYSNLTESVERWRKVDDKTIEADFWIFDPVNLAKPWYTRQSWTKLTNDDKFLRIRYWDCRENSNNAISIEADGTSQFPDLGWVEKNGTPAGTQPTAQPNP